MKNFFSLFLAITLCSSIFAQGTQPAVEVTITDVTTETFSAHFEPNAECASYAYLAMSDADIAQWTTMMGMTVDQLIPIWGITTSGPDDHTFDQMTPGSTYKILVLPYDANNAPSDYTYIEVTTLSTGGTGTSVINIEVSNITDTSAFVTCTPNEETALFYDGLVTVELYDEIGQDSACSILRENLPEPLYSTDSWEWQGLESGIEYYAIAFGQNSVAQWGDTTKVSFRVLDDEVGISENAATPVVIYPTLSDGTFHIAGRNIAGGTAQIFSTNGQLLKTMSLTSDDATIESGLPTGTYLLRVVGRDGSVKSGKVLIQK